MSDRANGPLTPAVFHVLLALADGPLHGYAIMKRVAHDSGATMGPGTIYGSLQRLTDASWVAEVETGDEGADARRGRSFDLTNLGREALTAEAGRIRRLAALDGVRTLAPDARSAS